MNSKHTPKFKALLALFLSISMLFSMVVTSFAALDLSEIDVSIEDVNDDDTIHYIAFGDSVTNGFGLAGYTYPIPNSEDKNSPNGFQVDTITAYPYLIKEALADYYGDEYTVTYEPLAISGMRLGDLRMILTSAYETKEEGRYDGDYYRYTNEYDNELWENDIEEWLEKEYYMFKAGETKEDNYTKYTTGTNGSKYVEYYKGTVGTQDWLELKNTRDLLYDEYTNEIKKADVLSIDLGTNDFGTFFTQRLQMLVGMDSKYPVGSIFVPGAIPEIDFSVFIDKADSDSLKKVFTELINQFLPAEDPTNYQAPDTFMNAVAKDLAETLVYGLMAFAYNFDASMEEIYKLNPDIQVMVIDCYNMMAGTTFKGLEIFGGADVLAIYDTFVDIANLYTRSLSPWASRLVHVDLSKVGSEDYPVLFLDYFLGYNEPITVDGVELVGWDAFKQRQYLELLEKYDEKEAAYWADFYTNEAKESVERFVMDAMGMRDEYGKWAPTKKGIDTLDEIVYNFPEFIDGQILGNVASGVQTAVDAVDTALEGCELILTAVNGVGLIGEAVNGVETASGLVELFTKDLNTLAGKDIPLFGSYTLPEVAKSFPSLKSTIISYIVDFIAGSEYASLLAEYNMSSAEAAELVWQAAIKYGSAPDVASARKATTTFIMIEFYKAAGKTVNGEPLDQTLADKVYEVVNVYNTTEGDEAAKTIAALTVYLDGDSDYATLAWLVSDAYNSVADEKAAMAAAMKAYLDLSSADENNATTADLGAELYYMAKNGADYSELVIFAIDQAMTDNYDLATALYYVYSGEMRDKDIVTIINNVTALAGIPAEKAEYLISVDEEIAEFYLNNADYSGRYTNDTVSKVAKALIMFNSEKTDPDEVSEEAKTNYGMYSVYSHIPEVFAGVAETNTIYFDALLGAISSGSFDPKSVVTPYIMEGKELNPSDPNYKLDCSFLTMYIRMLSLDGLFMHPGTEGQSTFGRLVAEALDEFVPNKVKGDSTFYMSGDESKQYRILSLGKGLSLVNNVNDDSYINYVVNTLDSVRNNVNPETDLVGDYIGEINSFGDNEYDIIFLNVGAGNISYPISVVASAMAGDPIAVPNLADLDILKASQSYDEETGKNDPETSIGARFDSMLGGDGMLGAVKAFMYGYADFASSLEPLVQEAVEHSPNAKIFLVGLPALVADGSVISYNGAAFNLDLLVDKIVSDFNGHMEVIAEKYENVFYIKTSDIDNGLNTNIVLSYSDNGASANSDIATAMSEVLFEEEDHREIAKRILCDTLGIHAPSAEPTKIVAPTCQKVGELHYSGCELCDDDNSSTYVIRYTEKVDHAYNDKADGFIWYDNNESADAIFECIYDCGEETVYKKATVTVEDTATCEKDGIKTFTAVYGEGEAELKEVKTVDSPAKGHAYGEPTWEWTKNEDGVYVNAEATFVCANDEEHVEKVSTEEFSVKVVTEPTCTGVGENEYTATVEFNDKEYSNTNPEYVVVDKIAHAYDKPVWAWSEDHSEATASFECIACDDVQVVEATVKTETTEPTCETEGKAVYTATAVFGDDKKEFTDSKTVKLEIVDHAYVDGVCKYCNTIDPDKAEISNKIEDVLDSVLTEEEKELIEEGYTVDIDLEVIDITENVPEEEKKLAEKHSGDGEVAAFFDVNIYKTVNDGEPTKISETSGKIKISIKVPAEFIKDKIFYQILRIHDGKADLLDCEFDPETGRITFKTDKFSTYVLIVNDISEDGDCVYVTEEELDADGVYTMTLGGEEVGEFEFVAVDGGWTISDDGEYLAIENGKLVYSENAFVWTFEDDMFSASETVVEEIKKGFWGGLFGGSDSTEIVETTTTYYLAVVEDELTASEIGDVAEFSVKHHDDKHSYDEGVVTKPTCTDKGYTTYTCEKCGEECVYNEREKIEHNYVDGECEDCGKLEDVEEPEEPEEPEENCIYIEEVELEEDGSYILSIGGYEVGKYTVTAVDDGWTIFDEKDETYLAVLNGILVYTDEEFVWAYDEEECKFFYEDVKVVTTTNNFWGGLFGGSTSTETIVTVYYIVPEEDKLVVSEDDELAEVTFEVIVVEEGHDYVDGICENCGKCEDDICVHFDAVELEENGEYVLIIGDEHLGFHTFENVDEDLWTIVNEDGDYVALEDGEIVYTSEEFVWTYDSEKSVFSVEIVNVATSGFWGGLFGGNTSTKVETYYLVAEDGNLAVSLKDKTATAEFLVEVEGEHEYGDLEDYYGLGRSFCENCGTVKFEIAE